MCTMMMMKIVSVFVIEKVLGRIMYCTNLYLCVRCAAFCACVCACMHVCISQVFKRGPGGLVSSGEVAHPAVTSMIPGVSWGSKFPTVLGASNPQEDCLGLTERGRGAQSSTTIPTLPSETIPQEDLSAQGSST